MHIEIVRASIQFDSIQSIVSKFRCIDPTLISAILCCMAGDTDWALKQHSCILMATIFIDSSTVLICTYQIPGLTFSYIMKEVFFLDAMSCKSVRPYRFRHTTIECNLYPCRQKSGSATEQTVMIDLTLLKIHDSHGYRVNAFKQHHPMNPDSWFTNESKNAIRFSSQFNISRQIPTVD